MNRFIVLIIFLLFSSWAHSQILKETRQIFKGSGASFSPDGNSIACEHNRKIWIVDLTTHKSRQVSTLAWDFRPRWSPDGNSIVFQSYGYSLKSRNFSIWIVNKDGTNQHQLYPGSDNGSGDQTPVWSPDGKKIAWTHGQQLWIADVNGKNAKPLTVDPALEYEFVADWSGDSKTILYVRTDRYLRSDDSIGYGYYEVCFVDTNSQNQKRIDILHQVGCAKFSKDGLSLYYTTHNNFINRYDIQQNKAFLNYLKITDTPGTDYFEFSPDFNSLLFDYSPNLPDEPDIYLMKISPP